MLWSKPTILYDVILDYRIDESVSFSRYWQIKNNPHIACMRSGQTVCTVTIPETIHQTSILWQHLFLAPLLKELKMGWHICLLPRHMVVVIKEGLYVCERLISGKEEHIESTKTYMYRFGYEADVPVQIHDWRHYSEEVTVPTHYDGFILQPYQPWYKHAQAVGLAFLRLCIPHTTSLLGATLLSLSLGSLYYGYQNHVDSWDRIRALQAWPTTQNKKICLDKLLELLGLLNEARAPTSLVQSIVVHDTGISVQCSHAFPPDKNLEVMKQFLKKYYPHTVDVSIGRFDPKQQKGISPSGPVEYIKITLLSDNLAVLHGIHS